jgi:hypothetical protein
MFGKVIGFVVVMLMLVTFGGPIADGIHDLRVENVTINSVETTAPAVTTADIVFTRVLWSDEIGEIVSIASTIAENPVATSYDPATETLTVSALTADATRTLTIIYNSEKEDKYLQIIGPFMLFAIVGSIVGFSIMGLVRKH